MKIFKRTVLGITFALVLFWICAVGVCEYNTYRYGEYFKNIKIHDIKGERYLKDEKVKVLKYRSDSAEIYAVWDDKVGNVYYFKRDNGNNWVFERYDTVWSKSGSADKFIFPYIR